VAAAVLNDPEKVAFVPMTPSARFPRLLSGEIDLLLRSTTWTLGREAFLGVEFAGVLYHDGQAFMVPRKSKVRRITDLSGATICMVKGTTHVENTADYFGSRGIRYQDAIFDTVDDAKKAFLAGKCAAFTSDCVQLSADRAAAPGGPDGFVILPDLISREPVGPAVRRGDEEWLTLVKWVLFTLIEAEDRGITKANVRVKAKTATDPSLRRFLGLAGGFGKALGVRDDWTVRVIESVGNYGEMFERNLGRQGPLKIERGVNRPWTKGGLLYAPPFR
jgi:general L-amino acid transport system substrate-binding protein